MRTRLSLKTGGELVNREGLVVGCVESITVNLDLGALGDYRGKDVDVLTSQGEAPLTPHEAPQTSMLADPVKEVWEHYTIRLERPKAQLTPKVRRWISEAIEAVGIDRCKRAIDGLAVSEHHRLGGYTGIEYALKPKVRETIEGRVSMMEAKAPTGSNGEATVDRLIARLPTEVHGMVRGWIADLEAHLRNPAHRGLAATAEGRVRALEAQAHMRPVIEDSRIVRWEDCR